MAGLAELLGTNNSRRGRVELGSDWSRGQFGIWPGLVNDGAVGPPITREQAEGLPGVGRGARLMAGVVAQLPMIAYRGLLDPDAPNSPVVPQPTVLRNPDPYGLKRSGWLAAVMGDLVWHGNAFAYRGEEVLDYRGFPLRLPLISAEDVLWDDYEHEWLVGPERVPVEEPGLLHFQVNAKAGCKLGRGVLAMSQDTLALIKATEHASHVVMASGRPVGVISLDGDPTPEQAKEYKQAFVKAMQESSVAAMSRATFAPVQWNANELALVPMREYNLRLASDVLNVTPYLLGVPSESRVYSNMENEWTTFLRTSLGLYTEAINDTMSTTQPNGTEVRVATDALVRADTKTRWDVYKVAVEIGALSPEEVRNAESMAPLGDTGGLQSVTEEDA
jgi:HK97 family phage portal protein